MLDQLLIDDFPLEKQKIWDFTNGIHFTQPGNQFIWNRYEDRHC